MAGDDHDRTIYSPGSGFTPGPGGDPPVPLSTPPAESPPTSSPPTSPPPQSSPPLSSPPRSSPPFTSPPPPGGVQAIKVGDVLNHLYEVRRHIARGGMGEVFEGCNVNYAEERVAIKVILPHLAADPAVQGMFYKEARTLTRLTHPALVQYRTMAQEPQLGVFYIVTEYVDGPNLSDKLRDLNADTKQIALLTKRLAEGLGVAHGMGAIHRDISPDNILLEGGSVERAKIIDFGIAKDLDPSAATIVGDGFAGKLNYVAPEQLGEFGREIGPWTDIYSLGLTILAVARGRDVDMGGTIVDAVDKRRAGPDLSPVPDGLRPLIARMVMSNPQQRMRSMDEVVQWINDWSQGKAAPEPAKGKGKAVKVKGDKGAAKPDSEKSGSPLDGIMSKLAGLSIPPILKEPRGMAIAGGGVLGLLVLVALVLSFTGGDSKDAVDAAGGPAGKVAAARVADPVATARSVLASGLAKVPCSWLDVEAVDGGGDSPVKVSLKGVSGQSSQAIAQIEQMLKAAGVGGVSVNYADIAPVPATFCGPLAAFSQVRGEGGHLSIPQTKFEMAKLDSAFHGNAGTPGAQVVTNLNLSGLPDDVAVVGITEKGEVQLLTPSRAKLAGGDWDNMGPDRYRATFGVEHPGWSGLMLLIGKKLGDKSLFTTKARAPNAEWPEQFSAAAKENGWKTEMVWMKVVNELSDDAPAPAAAPSQSAQ